MKKEVILTSDKLDNLILNLAIEKIELKNKVSKRQALEESAQEVLGEVCKDFFSLFGIYFKDYVDELEKILKGYYHYE